MTGTVKAYRFEGFVLNLARGALMRADREISLRPRSFELLRLLVDNAGRLLDRQTINAAVWPETVTTDENIAQCVRDVRHAIDDHGRSIIRTVPRRGYIFTAEVVETKPGGDTALSRVSTRAIGPTIAVLPFASLGRGITLANLAEGLADEVRTALSRLTPLTVMELCMRWPSAGPGESIRNVNVDYVLTGRINRSGQQFRVTVQLIDRATSAHIWACRYHQRCAPSDHAFGDLGDRIAISVARHIDVRVLARTRLALPLEPTPYELILHGRERLEHAPREELPVAESLFLRAIDLDTCCAWAHAELAQVYYDDVTWRLRPTLLDKLLGKGFDGAERALTLNDSLPFANCVLAGLHLRAREFADGLRWAEHAVALSPHDGTSHAALANILSYIGRSQEALYHMAQARALDPRSPPTWDYYTGRALVHLGRHELALIWLNRAMRRAPQVETWGGYRAAALAHLGRSGDIRDTLADLKLPRGYTSINMLLRDDSYRESPELEVLINGLRMAGFPE
jgi:DNA-binding winged helix-turn-helix (wHTH) protein/tetratricopeptide (TPR) repeat protein